MNIPKIKAKLLTESRLSKILMAHQLTGQLFEGSFIWELTAHILALAQIAKKYNIPFEELFAEEE